jgi:AAA15 family ATPase/GTPase
MRIFEIEIENFKAIEKLTISCNENVNIIIGENNIGKSTIFEAIQLWKLAYDTLINASGKNFYKAGTTKYLSFEQLFFLRVTKLNDVFFDESKNSLFITLKLKHEEKLFNLRIKIERPKNLESYLRVKYEGSDFSLFSDKVRDLGLNLNSAIFLYQTRPIFQSIKNEPFFNNAQLMKKISLGKSFETLRNKILKGDPSDRKFEKLQERLKRVFGKEVKLRFKNKSLQDEEFIRITYQETGGKEVDLSLVGSGILQVIDIISTIQYVNKREHCLNILLIDEPDSHIHSNLQSALVDELKVDDHNQIFLITHNDKLINKAEEGELLFLNRADMASGKINFLPKASYDLIAAELASKMFSLEELNRRKIIVLTEGKTDKLILETAWSKLNPGVDCPYYFLPSGIEINEADRIGNADTVRRTMELVSSMNFEVKLVGLFDNDREGNEKFSGLNNKIFEPYTISKSTRKHNSKLIFGVLLPVPSHRALFVTGSDMLQRYLVIEHFFSDDILASKNMKGANILGTSVFTIDGDKKKFSTEISSLNPSEFTEFSAVFNALSTLFI